MSGRSSTDKDTRNKYRPHQTQTEKLRAIVANITFQFVFDGVDICYSCTLLKATRCKYLRKYQPHQQKHKCLPILPYIYL